MCPLNTSLCALFNTILLFSSAPPSQSEKDTRQERTVSKHKGRHVVGIITSFTASSAGCPFSEDSAWVPSKGSDRYQTTCSVQFRNPSLGLGWDFHGPLRDVNHGKGFLSPTKRGLCLGETCAFRANSKRWEVQDKGNPLVVSSPALRGWHPRPGTAGHWPGLCGVPQPRLGMRIDKSSTSLRRG